MNKPATPRTLEDSGSAGPEDSGRRAPRPVFRTQMLREHVERLKLDPHAKFISDQDRAIEAAQDHKQMILAWRRAQQKVELRCVSRDSED